MSWLSQITGVHVSPKGFSVEPAKLLGDAAALAIPGVGGALGKIPGIGGALSGLGAKLGGGAAIGAVAPLLKNAVGGGTSGASPDQGGSGGGILGSIEGLLTGNGGLNALGIAGGVNSAMQQSQANNYAKNALSGVQSSYDARAPLRTAGIQGLLSPQTPSIAGLGSIAGHNPFAAGAPAPQAISQNQQMTMGMPNPSLAPVNPPSMGRVG